MHIKIKADVSNFLLDWRHLSHKRLPEAIVEGFSKTAETARDAVRDKTRRTFTLRSDYIINGIRSLPEYKKSKQSIRQKAAAVRGLTGRHRDFEASVFTRGSRDPSKGFGFMVLHETGGIKKPHATHENDKGAALALKGFEGLKYKFRTKRGRISKKWSPTRLLEYYNANPRGRRGESGNKTKGKPKPFLMKSTRGFGLMIARRKSNRSRKVEVLYRFVKNAKIEQTWGFVNTVRRIARMDLNKNVYREIKRMR